MTGLMLSGGGDEHQSASHHAEFGSRIDPTIPLLFIPGGAFPAQDSLRWVRGVFAPFGDTKIEMWAPPESAPTSLDQFSGMYIGGGNTFHLLDQFRKTRFVKPVTNYILSNRPVFGGSAGVIVLGKDLMTCSHMDDNDINLSPTTGLDVVHGCSMWCHYTEKVDALIFEYCNAHLEPVLAIAEDSAIRIKDKTSTAFTRSGAWLFERNSKTHIPPGGLVIGLRSF